VIFTPMGVAEALASPLTIAFRGERCTRGSRRCRLSGQGDVRTRALDWDDATQAYRPSGGPFDDEGVRAGGTADREGGCAQLPLRSADGWAGED